MAKAPKGKAASVLFSPHIHSPLNLKRVMWDVVIALIPASIAAVYFFGMSAARIMAVSTLTAVLTEVLMNLLMKKKITVLDGSAVITGLLFAFNLPPASPWYVIVFGSVFAVAIVKWAFGGLGQNIMNPALGGRIFVLSAWAGTMINNWSPTIRSFIDRGQSFAVATQSSLDAVSSASPLNDLKGSYELVGDAATSASAYVADAVTTTTVQLSNMITHLGDSTVVVSNSLTNAATQMISNLPAAADTAATVAAKAGAFGYSYWDMFIGNIPGCIGETSAFALLIGLIYLVVRKVLPVPVIPVLYIGLVAFFSWMLGGIPLGEGWFAGDALYHILGGGLFLGAIFMATDYVTSPMTPQGTVIFSFFLALLTVIIRLWGGYPEGVSYSIVLMNLFVPIIDRAFKPKIYGTSKKEAANV